MTFKQMFPYFVAGVSIKRKPWGGYWKYDLENDNVVMYTKEGNVISLTDTTDILYTLSNILSDDWEIATNENCIIELV